MPTPEPTRGVITAATEALLYADSDVLPLMPGRDFFTEKSQEWDTSVRRAVNGRETRIAQNDIPMWSWGIKHNFLRNLVSKPEVQKLFNFFANAKGKANCFYFYDPETFATTNQQFGVGDGTTKTFQPITTIGAGTGETEPVRAFWNNPSITVNGTANTQFTVNPWGTITFTTAPAAGAILRWTGQHLYVCRFDIDKLSLKQFGKALWSGDDGIPIVSLRP